MSYYKIIFPDENKMWDFIDAHIKSNYSANNFIATVELKAENHPKEQTVLKAQPFGGKVI